MSSGELGQKVWDDCTGQIRDRIGTGAWNNNFSSAKLLKFDDLRLVLGVAHSIAKERIEAKHLGDIGDVVFEQTGHRVEIIIELNDTGAQSVAFDFDSFAPHEQGTPNAPQHGKNPVEPLNLPTTPQRPINQMGTGQNESGPKPTNGSNFSPGGFAGQASRGPKYTDDLVLNARYTFEAFVSGPSNRFAHAAALSVAERPALSYNPLFIYGDSGLGKTHLLQAISHYVQENYSQSRIRYVSTEMFVSEFVDAIRTNSTPAFKRRYRDDVDVLLIDDIQFMEGKEGTQEEFFHTFNFLQQSGRQIVITSDRPPKAIATLEERLRSRFEWGLIVDIQPPDLETRVAILRKKADREGIAVPPEVLNFIATHLKSNIRELEGALNRVCAYAGLTRAPLELALAEQVLQDIVSGNEPRPVTAKAILSATSAMFEFTLADLTGQSRGRLLVTARQIAMYVFRDLTDFSYPMIGREFGDRDHTTVIHAVERIQEQMKERREIYEQVTELIKNIRADTHN